MSAPPGVVPVAVGVPVHQNSSTATTPSQSVGRTPLRVRVGRGWAIGARGGASQVVVVMSRVWAGVLRGFSELPVRTLCGGPRRRRAPPRATDGQRAPAPALTIDFTDEAVSSVYE